MHAYAKHARALPVARDALFAERSERVPNAVSTFIYINLRMYRHYKR